MNDESSERAHELYNQLDTLIREWMEESVIRTPMEEHEKLNVASWALVVNWGWVSDKMPAQYLIEGYPSFMPPHATMGLYRQAIEEVKLAWDENEEE